MEESEGGARVSLDLYPKQEQVFYSDAQEILFGGAAGGGKSHLMRVLAIHGCVAVPGLNVYLFRRRAIDLIKNHVEGAGGFRALLAPYINSGFVEIVLGDVKEIRFKHSRLGPEPDSKIFLCHLQHPRDLDAYTGPEIHMLLMDEVTHFYENMYTWLRGRTRIGKLRVDDPVWKDRLPLIVCSGNPGNVGHQWVKKTWIDPKPEGEVWQTPDNEGRLRRVFIKSLLEDCPATTDSDPSYEYKLQGLGSKDMVEAMRWGNWDILAGGFFANDFDEKNILEPFSIPDHWPKFRSFDWGSAKPFSVGWWAVADGDMYGIPRNAIVRYREWYGCVPGKDDKGLGYIDGDIARGIIEMTGDEEILYTVADTRIFDGKPGDLTTAEIFAGHGVPCIPAIKQRIPGWNKMKELMRRDEPLLYVFNTCRDFIRTITLMQYDQLRVEDMDSRLEDHIMDESRYAVASRFPLGESIAIEDATGQFRVDKLVEAHDKITLQETQLRKGYY